VKYQYIEFTIFMTFVRRVNIYFNILFGLKNRNNS